MLAMRAKPFQRLGQMTGTMIGVEQDRFDCGRLNPRQVKQTGDQLLDKLAANSPARVDRLVTPCGVEAGDTHTIDQIQSRDQLLSGKNERNRTFARDLSLLLVCRKEA